ERLEQTVADRTARLRDTIGELEAFSYSIAHDMRAPLRAMQGFGNILAEQYASALDDTGQKYVARITSAAERMDRLIQDVLNYSKIVRGNAVLGPVDLENLVRDILDPYPDFQPPRVGVVVQPPLPTVRGNTASLTQVISNLLGNAVKFVGPGIKP